jgi:hypothetical protein
VKVGDLVKVNYPNDTEWYTGFVTEIPTADPLTVYQMYCIEREAIHILNPDRDEIILLSEST